MIIFLLKKHFQSLGEMIDTILHDDVMRSIEGNKTTPVVITINA